MEVETAKTTSFDKLPVSEARLICKDFREVHHRPSRALPMLMLIWLCLV